MSTPILGKDIILYISKYNPISSGYDDLPIAAGRDVELNPVRDALESSSTESGKYREFIKGKISHLLNIGGLQSFSQSNYNIDDFYDATIDDSLYLNFSFSATDGFFTTTYTGKAIITSLSERRSYNDIATYDIQMQVTGEVIKTKTGSSLPYYWGISDTQLLPADIVNLIVTNQANTVNASSTAPIVIPWEAYTWKWLWFAYPASVPSKVAYYVDDFNSAPIGTVYDLFGPEDIESVSGDDYKIEQTNYPTITNNDLMKLL